MAKGTEAEGGDGAPKKAAGKGGGGEVPAAVAGEEVVMRAPVHCDGCGRKLRRSLERLDWVGEVSVDSSTDTVLVRGPKAMENAAKTAKIVERRTGGKAVLVSPAPEKLPPAPAPAKKETKKDDGNKDVNDLPEINMKMVVILRMNLHCDACCEEIKRRILRIKGVEDAVPHLKSSQMMVKGVVEPATLVGFIRSCTGRKAAIFRAEPLDPPPPPAAAADQAAEAKKEDTHAGHTREEKKHAQDDNRKEEEAPREEKKGGGGGDQEHKEEEKPADGGGAADEEHEHEDAAHGGEGEKHSAAGRLFAAPVPAGVFTVAPPEMTMGAISNVAPPYHHRYSYPSSAASYYDPYYAHPSYYQCQYPQQPYYYPPYMYGYYPQPETFTEENPNSCAIV